MFVDGFARTTGTLADHPIANGRDASESVSDVRAFTGQAFRAVETVEPLLRIPDGWAILLPSEAWEFAEDTPSISADRMLQGAVLRHGQGRVAVFGEAAMFTAQERGGDGETVRVGMNAPEAPNNAQFALNVLHWLSGLTGE